MVKPLAAPGLDLPEEGWTRDPKPGLYWVRYCNNDGTKTQPAFCIVTPTGPVETHAFWAWTPNIEGEPKVEDSWINYWVDPRQPIEYLPYLDETTNSIFEIVAKPA